MTLSLYKLAIPGIVALLAVGTAGFLLAFSYYPEKHVNVDIDGKLDFIKSSNFFMNSTTFA